MDEAHLLATLAYVALNPVRARLVARAQDWRWSSARAHLYGRKDGITALEPIRERVPRFADLLAAGADAEAFARLRAAESIGRPLGDDAFLADIERLAGRTLKAGKRGPKPGGKISALSPLPQTADRSGVKTALQGMRRDDRRGCDHGRSDLIMRHRNFKLGRGFTVTLQCVRRDFGRDGALKPHVADAGRTIGLCELPGQVND